MKNRDILPYFKFLINKCLCFKICGNALAQHSLCVTVTLNTVSFYTRHCCSWYKLTTSVILISYLSITSC